MTEQKVAFITGGDSGIGYGISEVFAQHKVNIAMVSYAKDHLPKAAKELADKYGVDVLPVYADISKEEDVKDAMAKTIDHFGHLDYAVNDAGISGQFKAFHELTADDFDKTMNVDLRGTFLSMSAEIKQFVKQGKGSIVNISALGAQLAEPSMSLYIAAKSGVNGLTRSVAMDYADKGIRVNAVSPGAVRTPMTASTLDDTSEGSFGSLLLSTIPMKRVADPKEIGEAVYFVSSDKASYMTGEIVSVDGGSSVGGH